MVIGQVKLHQENIVERQCNDVEQSTGQRKLERKWIALNNGIAFARPLNEHATLSLIVEETEGNGIVEKNNIRHPTVSATRTNMKICLEGEWFIEIMPMSQASTLFSFLDFQSKYREIKVTENPRAQTALLHTDTHLVAAAGTADKSFMGMLMNTMLTPQKYSLESLFVFVRNVESYWISHFLLSQVMNEDKESDTHKIYNASKIYGVSESYFRKLCHHAFARGPKKQLRIWRAANSALQLIEKDNSIAMIAGDNGYASSSHFSSEIKSHFGITPREFKKLEGLLHD
ncbi:helix-turn-helix domain-containing protein [Scandinavium sp.]|uniref:helix-turn-helix domain-containing protein n=1 Tax=Scandinavium sp. TaxID=2830653 RepID=UPI002897A966|nr:helix-turn-helix domain-containing protein [Scandinavium sp.]